MIILLGPDGTGKSILASRMSTLTGYPVVHFTKESTYEDYLKVLTDVGTEYICDRFIWCEIPYAKTRKTKEGFRFTSKQFHNATLLGLVRNPLVILCTHKPVSYEEDVLPAENWDRCLKIYKDFLLGQWIPRIDYDYENARRGMNSNSFALYHDLLVTAMDWWRPMWKSGWGTVGSIRPEVLVVAERIGPNNVNNIPFETGPTGFMLSEVLDKTQIPLGKIAVTNMVKDVRRSTRLPNARDLELLSLEVERLKPQGILFMGRVAEAGIEVAKRHNIRYETIPHLGALHHQGVHDLGPYCAHWNKLWAKLTNSTASEEVWKSRVI